MAARRGGAGGGHRESAVSRRRCWPAHLGPQRLGREQTALERRVRGHEDRVACLPCFGLVTLAPSFLPRGGARRVRAARCGGVWQRRRGRKGGDAGMETPDRDLDLFGCRRRHRVRGGLTLC